MQDTKSIKLFNQDLIRLLLRLYFFVLGSSAPFFPLLKYALLTGLFMAMMLKTINSFLGRFP